MLYAVLVSFVLSLFVGLAVVAVWRQAGEQIKRAGTRIATRILPLGLQEKLGIHNPTVEWKPSPEAQYRANLWAFVKHQLPGAPRKLRRQVFFAALRQKFHADTSGAPRWERRRTIRGG